jgi:hypothetical protein
MDRAWWGVHLDEVRRTFKGELATLNLNPHGIMPWRIQDYRNSGAGAIALAIAKGARRVLLLGYDMQYTGGLRHWHGDHPAKLGNAGKIAEWPAFFERLRRDHPDIEIINCSRETALTCFPRMPLSMVIR